MPRPAEVVREGGRTGKKREGEEALGEGESVAMVHEFQVDILVMEVEA